LSLLHLARRFGRHALDIRVGKSLDNSEVVDVGQFADDVTLDYLPADIVYKGVYRGLFDAISALVPRGRSRRKR
jgi:hypothetical protein